MFVMRSIVVVLWFNCLSTRRRPTTILIAFIVVCLNRITFLLNYRACFGWFFRFKRAGTWTSFYSRLIFSFRFLRFDWPTHWTATRPIMFFTFRSVWTLQSKRTVYTIDACPIMIRTFFISSAHFHNWTLSIPVMVMASRASFTNQFTNVTSFTFFLICTKIFFIFWTLSCYMV